MPHRAAGREMACGLTSSSWKRGTWLAHFLCWSWRCCSGRNVSSDWETWRSSSIDLLVVSAASVRPCSSCRHRVSPVAYFFRRVKKSRGAHRNGLIPRRANAVQSARVCPPAARLRTECQRVALRRLHRGPKPTRFAFWERGSRSVNNGYQLDVGKRAQTQVRLPFRAAEVAQLITGINWKSRDAPRPKTFWVGSARGRAS